MWNPKEVRRIEYKGDYVYHVAFDDDLSGDVDFEPYLGRRPAFEPLRDPDFLRQAMIERGTIA
jgi:hypothetical protein